MNPYVCTSVDNGGGADLIPERSNMCMRLALLYYFGGPELKAIRSELRINSCTIQNMDVN